MNFYIGTLGQLVIVELFVFWIWLKVLFETVKTRDTISSLAHRKLLLTSLGLVLNAIAIGGIMGVRLQQLAIGFQPFTWAIVTFYVMLGLGNFMFIVSASIGSNLKLLKAFIVVTALWTIFIATIGVDNFI